MPNWHPWDRLVSDGHQKLNSIAFSITLKISLNLKKRVKVMECQRGRLSGNLYGDPYQSLSSLLARP